MPSVHPPHVLRSAMTCAVGCAPSKTQMDTKATVQWVTFIGPKLPQDLPFSAADLWNWLRRNATQWPGRIVAPAACVAVHRVVWGLERGCRGAEIFGQKECRTRCGGRGGVHRGAGGGGGAAHTSASRREKSTKLGGTHAASNWAQGRPTHGSETSPNRRGAARQERQPGQGTRMEGMGERAHGRQQQQRGWLGQPAPLLPGARATPAQPASRGGCLRQPRWAVCAPGAGAHQGQTSREGERDI